MAISVKKQGNTPIPPGVEIKKLPPQGGLHLTRCALEVEFPENDDSVRAGGEADSELLKRYQRLRGDLRTLALEMAEVERQLKTKIGFHAGLEIPGRGILFWTKSSSSRRNKVNWMALVKALRISESTINQFKVSADRRRFFFRKGPKDPDRRVAYGDELELDEDL